MYRSFIHLSRKKKKRGFYLRCFYFSSFLFEQSKTQKDIYFIYELCVVQEWQLEVHHVSSWLVDDFLTIKIIN